MPDKKITERQEPQTTIFHCKVKIKGVEISAQNVISLAVRENVLELLPKLELVITDNGLFFESLPLEDNDLIEIEIGKDEEHESPVQVLPFLLQDFEVENSSADRIDSVLIRITAIFKTTDMFLPIKNRSFTKKSSLDALKEIAEECGFKVTTKTKTRDVMSWLQLNIANFDMITELINKSYIDDNDTLFAYVDRLGKFNITSLLTELKKEEVKKVVYSIENSIIDKSAELEGLQTNINGNDETENEEHFNNFKHQNLSGHINKTIGYGVEYDYYGLDGENTSEIIDSDEHELTELSFKNKNNVGKIVKKIVFGTKYDDDNMHDEFLKATVINKYLKETFFFSPVSVYINATDKIRLFDKINIIFPGMVAFDGEDTELNQSYSGEYIIGSIVHQVSRNGSYKMILNMFRNGINKNVFIQDSEYSLNS